MPKCTHAMTPFTKGEASTGYMLLAAAKPLPIVLKASSSIVVTDSTRQRRVAAASRWHKARVAAALAAGLEAPPKPPVSVGQVGLVDVRHAHRGELDLVSASYRTYGASELLRFVYQMCAKQLKWSEFQKLYDESKVRAPPSTVLKVLYPKGQAEKKIALLKQQGMMAMGAPRKVLGSQFSLSPPLLSLL